MTSWDVVTILAVGLISVGIGALARRVPPSWRLDGEQPTTKLFGDLNKTLFAFVMALAIVSAWGSLKSAQEGTTREANSLADVYWAAAELPEPMRTRFQQLTRDYTTTVIRDEWPAMAERTTSPEAAKLLDTLRLELNRPSLSGADEANRRDALTAVRAAMDERRERVLRLTEGIPEFLWIGLLVAAALILIVPAL